MGNLSKAASPLCHVVYLFGLASCIILFAAGIALSEPISSFSTVTAKLQSRQLSTCSSGFFPNTRQIITAAHAAKSFCPLGRCAPIEVELYRYTGGNLSPLGADYEAGSKISVTPRLKAIFPALDVGVLEVELPSHAFGDILPALPSARAAITGEQALVLGWPFCSHPLVARGRITTVDRLGFVSVGNSSPGLSGALVLAEDGAWLGVATSAADLAGTLWTNLSGRQVDGISASAAELVPLLGRDHSQAIERQALLLFDYYFATLRKYNPKKRLLKALLFFERVDSLRDEALANAGPDEKESLLPWASLGQYPNRIPATSGSEAPSAVSKLVFAYNLELKGPHYGFEKKLSDKQFRAINSAIGAEDLFELYKSASNTWWKGVEFVLLISGLWAAVIMFCTAAIIGFAIPLTWICAGRFLRAGFIVRSFFMVLMVLFITAVGVFLAIGGFL